MTETVEYCLNNVDATTRRRLGAIEAVNVVEKRCLQRCGECYRDSVLVVDGELATADSHADLLEDTEGIEE